MNQLFVNFIYSLKNSAIFKKKLLYFFSYTALAKLFYKIGLIQDFKLITVNKTRKIVVTFEYYNQANELQGLKQGIVHPGLLYSFY
jgi:hypothetical protein